jgi:hypothetical protein
VTRGRPNRATGPRRQRLRPIGYADAGGSADRRLGNGFSSLRVGLGAAGTKGLSGRDRGHRANPPGGLVRVWYDVRSHSCAHVMGLFALERVLLR